MQEAEPQGAGGRGCNLECIFPDKLEPAGVSTSSCGVGGAGLERPVVVTPLSSCIWGKSEKRRLQWNPRGQHEETEQEDGCREVDPSPAADVRVSRALLARSSLWQRGAPWTWGGRSSYVETKPGSCPGVHPTFLVGS